MEEVIISALVFVAILLLVFLILREVMCWYWKINERITLQKETNLLLKKLIEKGVVSNNTEEKKSEVKKTTEKVYCTNCGHLNEIGVKYCSECLRKLES